MQCQPVVAPNLPGFGYGANFLLFAIGAHYGEIFIVFQRLDVFLGERGQFVLAVGAVAIEVQAIERHLRVGVIKGPFQIDAFDEAVIGEHDAGLHIGPNMGVGLGPRGTESAEHCSHDNIGIAAPRHS